MQNSDNFSIQITEYQQNSWFLYQYDFKQINLSLMNTNILSPNHTHQGVEDHLQQKSTSLSTDLVDNSKNINVGAG
jgi:hypothetical protein